MFCGNLFQVYYILSWLSLLTNFVSVTELKGSDLLPKNFYKAFPLLPLEKLAYHYIASTTTWERQSYQVKALLFFSGKKKKVKKSAFSAEGFLDFNFFFFY